jgi:hydrogenase nickel incorporation protein HypA/HybF
VHELSVATAIIDTAVAHAGGRPVEVVSVRVGKLRQVVPSQLEFLFGAAARDTLCAGATLEVDYVDAELECTGCSHRWDPRPNAEHDGSAGWMALPRFRCPECGSAAARTLAGGELEVEAIEVVERGARSEELGASGPRGASMVGGS